MSFSKPTLIEPSQPLKDFFGDLKPLIVAHPEHLQRLSSELEAAGFDVELAPEGFGTSDADAPDLGCIIVRDESQVAKIKAAVRKFKPR